MLQQKYIVFTQDTYLRCSIDALMQASFTEKILCFCDVDSFPTLDALYRAIESVCADTRIITISRGLWLSRLLGTLVDLEMTDDFYKWRLCIFRGQKNHSRKVIDKILSIRQLKTLTRREIYVIHLLLAANSVSEAAKLARVDVKFFQAITIAIARKYNLRNSNELHFFVRKFMLWS